MKYSSKYVQIIILDITGNFVILVFEKMRISCILLMLLRIAFVYERRVFFLTHNVKKIRRFYGKVPGNQLLAHFPLFLRASACRTFLEIKIW